MAAGHWVQVADSLSRAVGRTVRVQRARARGGGCINQGFRVDTDVGAFFVKLNTAARAQMFEAEAEGLRELGSAAAVRVPRPIASGTDGTRAWLVLEYLPLAAGGAAEQRELGCRLAALHRHTGTCFGWTRDNTVGSTPQHNDRSEDWPAFWRERRLRVQLELAARNGYGGRLQETGDRLLDGLGAFFRSYSPVPSLLHGDLWGGNVGFAAGREPVIFDPAVYYGDRETDLAMTELFGGFSAAFYSGYAQAWPLDAGYARRRDLYNLYHVLNHLNLFGGGYLEQAQRMIDRLLQFD